MDKLIEKIALTSKLPTYKAKKYMELYLDKLPGKGISALKLSDAFQGIENPDDKQAIIAACSKVFTLDPEIEVGAPGRLRYTLSISPTVTWPSHIPINGIDPTKTAPENELLVAVPTPTRFLLTSEKLDGISHEISEIKNQLSELKKMISSLKDVH
jgi:hypothetical protein